MFDDGEEVEKGGKGGWEGKGGSVEQPASSHLPLPPADFWRALSGASEPRLPAITIFTIKMAPSPFSERNDRCPFMAPLLTLKLNQGA